MNKKSLEKMHVLIAFTLLFSSMLQDIALSSYVKPGEPISGVSVKVGRKPPGGTNFFSETVTNEQGSFEFSNLTQGDYSYFVEYGIKENGIKSAANFRIEEIASILVETDKRAKPRPVEIKKTIKSVEHGWIDISITYDGNNLRGSIVQSRSNIKSRN